MASGGGRLSWWNYAAPRLRYAAANPVASTKWGEFAGLMAVGTGPRRTSDKYAAAATVVEDAIACVGSSFGVSTPATERACDWLG